MADFTPPPVSALQPEAPGSFTPPPISALQPEGRGAEPASLGGTASTMADQAKRALGAAWETVSGVGHLLTTNPATTAKQAFAYTSDAIGRVKDAAGKGDYQGAAIALLGSVPLVGPQAEQIVGEIHDGKYAEAIGHAAALRALAEAPEAIGKLPGAAASISNSAGDVAAALKAGAKAGGRDVAVGAAKTGAGAAIITYGPNAIADTVAGYPLVRAGGSQIVKGVQAGTNAAKQAFADAKAAAARGDAAPRIPVWQGPPAPTEAEPAPQGPLQRPALPSGRKPGGPAIDTATGEIVPPAGLQQENPAKAAFEAKTPEPQVAKIPADSEGKPVRDFAAEGHAKRAAERTKFADALDEQVTGGSLPITAVPQITPGIWQRLAKSLEIDPPRLKDIPQIIEDVQARAAARDLAKTQEGIAAAGKTGTMMSPSDAYREILMRPRVAKAALAHAQTNR